MDGDVWWLMVMDGGGWWWSVTVILIYEPINIRCSKYSNFDVLRKGSNFWKK